MVFGDEWILKYWMTVRFPCLHHKLTFEKNVLCASLVQSSALKSKKENGVCYSQQMVVTFCFQCSLPLNFVLLRWERLPVKHLLELMAQDWSCCWWHTFRVALIENKCLISSLQKHLEFYFVLKSSIDAE